MDITGKQHIIMALCLILASCGFGAAPVTVEVVKVGRIWDKAPHNAFTDLVRWQDAFYCAFREGRGHVSTDGRIRILESKDANVWSPAALISLEGFDLRDAHLSVTPDGWLMLLGGAAPREKDNQSAPTGTFVSFSEDGRQWTEPHIVVEPGRWLWCVTWHEGKAYGVSYTAGQGVDRYLDLLVSGDGIHYEPHVPKLFEQGYPTEVTLRFDSEGTCYALVRRDRRGDDPSSALLGISKPNYKQWQWKDLGAEFNGFGGPNFIRIPGGFWLAAGRMHDGGAHTAITYLDVENGTMTKLAKLPSGGDTSYPGMVWHNGTLYISYYSSHEGKTSIYLAKVKIGPTGLCKITGVVRDKDSRLIAGVEVRRLHGPGPVNTDSRGKFELVWDPLRNKPLEDTYYIIARHYQDNLSVVVEVPEFEQGTEIVNLNLKPGVTFKGKIVDPAGRGVDQANISILLHTPTQGSGIYDTVTDYQGLFEFKGMPTGHEYSFAARAPGHGTKWVHDINAGHNYAQKDYNLEPITLAIADQSVTGLVVDANDKPVSGVLLLTDGEGQPNLNVRTDAEGKFTIDKVCTGDLRIYATVRIENPPSGYVLTYGGATDVRIVVKDVPSPDRQRIVPKSPPSLIGKSLPLLENLNIRFDADQAKDKMILVCFFDMNQRPSRNCITQLAKQAERLKEKSVAVIAIHASNVDKNALNEWIKKNNIPFPVGMIRGGDKKTRFAWGVKSLPWLILTDSKHIVTAEGFGVDELNSRIDEITKHVSSTRKISGLVSAITGDTQVGVEIKIVPSRSGLSSSDAEGRFDLEYEPKIDAGPETDYYLSARNETRNLAAFQLVDENTKSVELKLDPAVTLTGIVVDTEGRYVANAEVRILIRGANWKGPITYDTTQTDANGLFRFKAISTELPISNVIVTAKGYCQHFVNRVDVHNTENDIKLKTITLHQANLSVSGVVVDVNDKSVSGAIVKVLGGGEPRADTITDTEGRFKVDKLGRGGIRIIAKRSGDIPLEGFVDSQAGTTDVKVKLAEVYKSPRLPKSKVGKSLSEINDLEIGFNTETLGDSVILLCFFNYEQRPSRNCIIQLAEQVEELKQKGVTVVAIQSSKVDKNTLQEWVKKNDIPFTVGMIQDDENKTRFNWGVKSLPWLILTDRSHVIHAEGFGFDNLDNMIEEMNNVAQ